VALDRRQSRDPDLASWGQDQPRLASTSTRRACGRGLSGGVTFSGNPSDPAGAQAVLDLRPRPGARGRGRRCPHLPPIVFHGVTSSVHRSPSPNSSQVSPGVLRCFGQPAHHEPPLLMGWPLPLAAGAHGAFTVARLAGNAGPPEAVRGAGACSSPGPFLDPSGCAGAQLGRDTPRGSERGAQARFCSHVGTGAGGRSSGMGSPTWRTSTGPAQAVLLRRRFAIRLSRFLRAADRSMPIPAGSHVARTSRGNASPGIPSRPLDGGRGARYVMVMRTCQECGVRLPRSMPDGRPLVYCSGACRQKAYRGRGGVASGTSGAQRRRARAGVTT
jgi:hypothetical protein